MDVIVTLRSEKLYSIGCGNKNRIRDGGGRHECGHERDIARESEHGIGLRLIVTTAYFCKVVRGAGCGVERSARPADPETNPGGSYTIPV